MNKQTNIAPKWRLLEPGEIIQDGDEGLHVIPISWNKIHPRSAYIGRPVIEGSSCIFRRCLEPDPVKAELFSALENLLALDEHDEKIRGESSRRKPTRDAARAAIDRAKSTA